MKISQSKLELAAEHSAYSRRSVYEHLQLDARDRPLGAPVAREVAISAAARRAQAAEARGASDGDATQAAGSDDPRLQLLIEVVEFLTGRKVSLFDARRLLQAAHDGAQRVSEADAPATPPAGAANIRYERTEVREEAERVRFAARGSITTADGRALEFELGLQLERYERQQSRSVLQLGEPERKDPLVLNLQSASVALSTRRFSFDLDADGSAEAVPLFASGSGYLTLDLNDNGRTDDGSELFGARTGDGFAELAAYDEDGNGWIDEADAIFSRLELWIPDERGEGSRRSLAEAGVGALALTRTATPYTLKQDGETLGYLRDSSVFVRESGEVGSLQRIDLAV